MAHQAKAYPGFRSMKRLGVLLLPLDGMLVHRRVTPSSKFAGTHLYTWVKRGTMRVKYLAQERNAVPRPGLEPGPPDPESSALTIRTPRLPQTSLPVNGPKSCCRPIVSFSHAIKSYRVNWPLSYVINKDFYGCNVRPISSRNEMNFAHNGQLSAMVNRGFFP